MGTVIFHSDTYFRHFCNFCNFWFQHLIFWCTVLELVSVFAVQGSVVLWFCLIFILYRFNSDQQGILQLLLSIYYICIFVHFLWITVMPSDFRDTTKYCLTCNDKKSSFPAKYNVVISETHRMSIKYFYRKVSRVSIGVIICFWWQKCTYIKPLTPIRYWEALLAYDFCESFENYCVYLHYYWLQVSFVVLLYSYVCIERFYEIYNSLKLRKKLRSFGVKCYLIPLRY